MTERYYLHESGQLSIETPTAKMTLPSPIEREITKDTFDELYEKQEKQLYDKLNEPPSEID